MKVKKDPVWIAQVGERLVRGLWAVNKKPAEICRLFDIKPAAWSNYANGVRPLDVEVAIKLAKKFGFTLDWLYMGVEYNLPSHLSARIGAYGPGETSHKNRPN